MKYTLKLIGPVNILSFLLIWIILVVAACNNSSTEKGAGENAISDASAIVDSSSTETDKAQSSEPVNASVKTFKDEKGWGYDIFIDDKLYIHQPNIPSVPGNDGFKSEVAARKAGDFVAYKIQNNIMPPSVTPKELDSLGVTGK